MGRPKTLKQAVPGLLRTIRFLNPYTRKHLTITLGAFVAMFVTVAMRALEPWPLQLVIDYIIMPSDDVAPIAWAFLKNPTNLLLVASLAFIVVKGGRAVAGYLYKVASRS